MFFGSLFHNPLSSDVKKVNLAESLLNSQPKNSKVPTIVKFEVNSDTPSPH